MVSYKLICKDSPSMLCGKHARVQERVGAGDPLPRLLQIQAREGGSFCQRDMVKAGGCSRIWGAV